MRSSITDLTVVLLPGPPYSGNQDTILPENSDTPQPRANQIVSWSGVAIALLVIKVLTVLLEIKAISHIHNLGLIYVVGKTVPTLICFAFYNDALANDKKNVLKFWLWMLAVVPVFTIVDMTYLRGLL
jgi:hypothetical protein